MSDTQNPNTPSDVAALQSRLIAMEASLRELQDKEAIRELLACYGPLADSAGDSQRRTKAATLFSDDGTYDLGAQWQATGHEAIAGLLDNPAHLDLVANGSAHVMGMPSIKLTGDTATALSYSRVYRHCDGQFEVWRVSINLWECERVDGQWHVTRRANRLLDGSEESQALLRLVDGHVGL